MPSHMHVIHNIFLSVCVIVTVYFCMLRARNNLSQPQANALQHACVTLVRLCVCVSCVLGRPQSGRRRHRAAAAAAATTAGAIAAAVTAAAAATAAECAGGTIKRIN